MAVVNATTLLGRRPARTPVARRWRPGRRTLAALIAVIVVLGGGWLWLRQSSLVAVRHVTVVGVSGADAGQVRRVLVAAGKGMTTLDVNVGQLRTAVAPYPDVKGLQVSTQFPHGLLIVVSEDIPIAVVSVGGQQTEVAADGVLLRDRTAAGALPEIPMTIPPGGTRLTERSALNELDVLAAAPYQFLPKISQVTTDSAHGVVVALRDGPSIYFGGTSGLAAKWRAAVAVLADQGSDGALYIDVTNPQRPAAGGGSAAAQLAAAGQSAATSGAATVGGATTTAAGTGQATSTSASGTTTTPAATTTAPTGTTTAPTGTTTAPAGTTTAPAQAGTTAIP
ncbi:MAG TPA: cell division protein FtsQ/DivIB [Solirubrobacteraceae bacterium]|nr:cell division protein FtsQ/DivIB [Solirubrobacteraceae bacterium]